MMSDFFWSFLTPLSDFYILMSGFLGPFQTPIPLKSDIINGHSLGVSYGFVGYLGDLLLGSSYSRVHSGLVQCSFRVRLELV